MSTQQKSTMIFVFVLLSLICSGRAALAGVEPFDYTEGDFTDAKRNGGEGFANNSQWAVEAGSDMNCVVARVNWNVSGEHVPQLNGAKSPFSTMVGTDPTAAGATRKCLMHREISPAALGFAPATLWWFSLLVGVNRSFPVWNKPLERREDVLTPAFLFSIGDTEANVRSNGDVAYGGIYSSGITLGPTSGSLTGGSQKANVSYLLQMVGFNAVTFGTSRISAQFSNEWPSSALMVVSLQWDQSGQILPRHYFRAALFDASLPPPKSMPSDAAQVYLTGGSPTQKRFLSIWLQNSFAAWLRVGDSFDSVVGNATVSLSTQQSTSSSRPSTTTRATTSTSQRATTTTTTTASTTNAAPATLPSGLSTASESDVASTTAIACDTQTSCSTCFGGGGKCTWCVSSKKCLSAASVNGGSCNVVAVSIKSCEASDAVMDSASLGAPEQAGDDSNLGAIVGGAVGGCVALLLLLLLIVFLVRRSRNSDERSPTATAAAAGGNRRERTTSRAPESDYEFADLAAMREEASHYKAMEMAP